MPDLNQPITRDSNRITWGWLTPFVFGVAFAAACGGKATDHRGGGSNGEEANDTVTTSGDGDGDDEEEGPNHPQPHTHLSAECREAASLADPVADPTQAVTVLAETLLAFPPDDELLARAGSIQRREELYELALELLSDSRAFYGAGEFFPWWLTTQRYRPTPSKSPDLYPEFDAEAYAAMADEARHFGLRVLDPENELDFAALLTDGFGFFGSHDWVYEGSPQPGETMFERPERFGIFSLPLFAAHGASAEVTAPGSRGRVVREQLLCSESPLLPSIPEISSEYEPPMRVWWQKNVSTTPPCQACHTLFGELGLGFEQLDPVGAFRETEAGFAIDTTTLLVDFEEEELVFAHPEELMRYLSKSAVAWECMGQKWVEFYFGRSSAIREEGEDLVEPLVACASESGAFVPGQYLSMLVASDEFQKSFVCGKQRCLAGEICQASDLADPVGSICLAADSPIDCVSCFCSTDARGNQSVDCSDP